MDAQPNTRYHVHGQESPDDAGERSAMKVACCVRRGEVGKVPVMATRQPPTLHCYDVEMQRALQKQAEGRTFVVPIILRPVDWEHSPIGHLQVLPRGGKPVTSWQGRYGRDKAFLDVALGLRDIIITTNEIRVGKVETAWAVSDNPSTPKVDYAATLKQHMAFLDNQRNNADRSFQKYEETLAIYEQNILLNPKDAASYSGKGDMLKALHHYEDALIAYEKAINLNPHHAETYVCKGNTHLCLHQIALAIEAYKRAIQLDPRNSDVYEKLLQLGYFNFITEQSKAPNEISVTPLLEWIALTSTKGTDVAAQTWLNTAHPNFAKTLLLLSRSQLNSLRELIQESPLPRRVFLQYINPEILSLYGINRKLRRQDLYKHALSLTKYALLLSGDILIIPASYLFEVDFINQFLKELKPLQNAGILQCSSQTADLYEYVRKKRVEYRDELVLFPDYAREDRELTSKRQSLSWIPRIQRSTVKDISIAWRKELYENNGLWTQVLEEQAQKRSLLPSKLESAIELLPGRLEGRAFIYRYIEPLLPMILDSQEKTQINMLICRTYLESYVEEFDAMILVDTPIGGLDCGLPQINASGSLRTISFRALSASLRMINILDYSDNRLNWDELIELREQPTFRWLMALVVRNMLDPSRPLNTAILRSRYQPKISSHIFVRQPLQEVIDHILQLFATIEPFLESI